MEDLQFKASLGSPARSCLKNGNTYLEFYIFPVYVHFLKGVF